MVKPKKLLKRVKVMTPDSLLVSDHHEASLKVDIVVVAKVLIAACCAPRWHVSAVDPTHELQLIINEFKFQLLRLKTHRNSNNHRLC